MHIFKSNCVLLFCFVFHLVVGPMQLLLRLFFFSYNAGFIFFFLHVWRYFIAIFQTYQCLLPPQVRWKYTGKNEWVVGGEEVSVSLERREEHLDSECRRQNRHKERK